MNPMTTPFGMSFEAMTSWSTVLLTLATMFLGWFTYRLWKATATAVADSNESIAIARKSLAHSREAMEADQRPWLHMTCGLTRFEREDRAIGAEGYRSTVSVSLSNQGKSPAIKMEMHCEIFFLGEVLPSSAELLAENYQKSQEGKGSVPPVFPGLGERYDRHVWMMDADIEAVSSLTGMTIIEPYLICTLTYRSPHSDDIHQTTRAYRLWSVEDGELRTVNPSKDDWWTRVDLDGVSNVIIT